MTLRRDLQLDDISGMIVGPVQESWLTEEGKGIPTTKSSNVHSVEAGPWLRSAFDHDGVVDIFLERMATPTEHPVYRYHLETEVTGDVLRSNKNEVVWEDSRTRVTVLTSWNASMDTSGHGRVEVMLDSTTPILARIRIIAEDVDIVHKTGRNETYYFGGIVTEKFRQPPVAVSRVRYKPAPVSG